MKDTINLPAVIILYFMVSLFFIFSTPVAADWNSYSHFLISRDADRFPSLFFNVYGKPLFTLLSFPSAQVSFLAYRIFSVAIGAGCLVLVYLISRRLKLRYPLLPVIFTAFSTYFFFVGTEGLTEGLGALALLGAIYAFMQGKYALSAVIASSFILIRSEAIILVALWGLLLLAKRKVLALPLLFTCSLAYALMTLLVFKDFFYYIHNSVNISGVEASGIYPPGPLLFYIVNLVAGAGPLVFLYFQPALKDFKRYAILILPAMWYLVFLSTLQWLGVFSATGLLRYLAVIIPLLGILAGAGVEVLLSSLRFLPVLICESIVLLLLLGRIAWFQVSLPLVLLCMAMLAVIVIMKLRKTRIHALFLVLALASLLLTSPYLIQKHPLNTCYNLIFKEACDFVISQNLSGRELYTHPPYPFYYLDKPVVGHLFSKNRMKNGFNNGSILLYDNKFSPIEGQIPTTLFSENPDKFRLLGKFRQEGDMIKYCGSGFNVSVYEVI